MQFLPRRQKPRIIPAAGFITRNPMNNKRKDGDRYV